MVLLVLARQAWSWRPPGRRGRLADPSREVMEISSAEAFSRAADAFYLLLCALGDDDAHGEHHQIRRKRDGDARFHREKQRQGSQPAQARGTGLHLTPPPVSCRVPRRWGR